ncbi:MAG: RIP metalloprotease RseP [Bacteroidales bacterium]
MDILIQVGQLLLSLSILVIFHEMGHFAFAKLFKTRVEKFYLFFNPWFSLIKKKWGETEYGIGWLPLGGYVKISGMIDESMDKEQMKQPPQPWEFRTKPAWQRLLIMVGGVLVNFILAFLIYVMILTIWGRDYLPTSNLKYGIMVDSLGKEIGLRNGDKIISVCNREVEDFSRVIPELLLNDPKSIQVKRNEQIVDLPITRQQENAIVKNSKQFISIRTHFVIGGFEKGSSAEKSGLKENDRIIGLNDSSITYFDEFAAQIKQYKGQDVKIKVLRNSEESTFVVKVSDKGIAGIYNALDLEKEFGLKTLNYSFFEAIPAGITIGYQTISDQVKQLKLIPRHADQLGGFITIGKIFSKQWDWERFWNLTAMLSVMLAVLNLLPIPALDGGHVLFLLVEIVTRRKPSEKFLEYAQIVGLVILFSLLIYVNGNDIFRLFK